MWKCTYVALSLLYFAYAIQVPIVVKDTSGYGAPSFPTSVVIPLPYGAYQSTSSFRLSDSSHTTIPCQFVVQSRWAAKDNSIRHVVAHFSATVAPYTGEGTGTTTIYFSDDGTGDVSPTSNAVTITDNTSSWSISNGLVSLQVDKSSFTTISSLTLNGNALLTSRYFSPLNTHFLPISAVLLYWTHSAPLNSIAHCQSTPPKSKNLDQFAPSSKSPPKALSHALNTKTKESATFPSYTVLMANKYKYNMAMQLESMLMLVLNLSKSIINCKIRHIAM